MGDWTVDSGVDFSQVMQGATYIVDHMLEDNEIQKHGTRIILDYKGLHLSWILQFLPPHRIPVSLGRIPDQNQITLAPRHHGISNRRSK